MVTEKSIDILEMIMLWGLGIAGAILIIAVIAGLVYRAVKKKPYKGNPPIGIMNDLPSSITGANKYK